MQAKLLSASTEYNNYAPAYRQSDYSLRWSGADVIPQLAGAGVIIKLPELKNPTGGPSIISGVAYDSATNTVLPDKIMFITDMQDVPVSYAYTAADGSFTFGNLPFGTYKLFGDVRGKDNLDLVITVDADHIWAKDVIFLETSTEYKGWRRTTTVSEAANTLSGMYIYPNPVQDILSVKNAEHMAGDKHVTLLNTSGAVVFTKQFEGGAAINIPVGSLPHGLYMLHLQTDIGKIVMKLIK